VDELAVVAILARHSRVKVAELNLRYILEYETSNQDKSRKNREGIP
jgi:hypothetical protein